MATQQVIIIGANSAIAKALYEKIQLQPNTLMTVIARNASNTEPQVDTHQQSTVQTILINTYDEVEITKAVERIKENSQLPISQVFICNGVLHTNNIKPERRLEDFSVDAFHYILSANTVVPLLCLQQLLPLLSKQKSSCKITILSARVGSITDNKLGGWYSYRASKSALNMLLKTASIEFKRRAKHVKLISFHPGTTDSGLSKPFQKNVAEGKLFTPDFVAEQLLSIVEKTLIDNTLSYIDWQGKHIDW